MTSTVRNRGSRRVARLGLAALMLLAAFDASHPGAQRGALAPWNDDATAHGWLVVDMKQDWRTVFAFEQ
jgi:hypothetical protein